ncbi:MAG: DUF3014 domain-containing protein [Gammaproteobacteria bacterium]|nr:DUF3014 domain-containing protein [Gammaproteobacteria bacterium]
MKQSRSDLGWTAGLILVAVVGAAYYLLWMPRTPGPNETVTLPVPPSGKIASPPAPPPIEHPIAEAPAQPPEAPAPENAPAAPPADEPAFEKSLGEVLGAQTVEQHLNMSGFAQHFVATIDNLPRESVNRVNPLKPVGTPFAVAGEGESITIAPANDARYAPLVSLVEATDTRRLAELYVRHYPLFQHAYEELGYPGRYFNDRLVQVIDHLLQAPELDGPVRLIQPKVMYQYADPSLESRSTGQKMLMRMGKANEVKMKAKLRELRALIAKPGQGPEKVDHPE